jgi:hypothetical protein
MSELKSESKRAEISNWYRMALGREPDKEGLDFWSDYKEPNLWAAFLAAALRAKEKNTGWTPEAA